MVRTRDLILLLLVLAFLGIVFLSTMLGSSQDMHDSSAELDTTAEVPEYVAQLEEGAKLDRQATIKRLQSLLAEGDVISASPSVEDEVFGETLNTSDSDLECGVLDTGITIARSWPISGVAVHTAEGMRVVTHAPEVAVAALPIGTSTATLPAPAPVVTKTLLVMPQFPIKAVEPTCLDSEIIGVTVNGSLMFNNDVILYRNTAPNTLIGYARDGFPIYGAYAGAVDECGGYDGPTGYRYVAGGEATFMKCFTGAPSRFTP